MTKQFIADVIQEFQCKLTGQYFRVGSQYVGDEDRVNFLTEAGYTEGATEVVPFASPENESDGGSFPKHVGGGHFELSNGEKVKGKEAAEEAEKKLQEQE